MSKKKYRPISVHFDIEDSDDKTIIDWLEKNKNKMNSYSSLIRKAILEFIKNEEGNQ